jgi:hypothetical protein
MDWHDLGKFVEEWAAQHALPADLKGRQLLLVEFGDDADCAFFYPGRSQFSQNAFTVALAGLVRRRHGRTTRLTIRPEHYREWLLAQKLSDSEQQRLEFIESRYRLEVLAGLINSPGQGGGGRRPG